MSAIRMARGARRPPGRRGGGGEQRDPAQAADADAGDQQHGPSAAPRRWRPRRSPPRTRSSRVGRRRGHRGRERAPRRVTSSLGLRAGARGTRRAACAPRARAGPPRRAAPRSSAADRSRAARPPGGARRRVHGVDERDPARRSPARPPSPLRRVERMRNSDIGPSCMATRNPRPNPIVRACMAAGYRRDCGIRKRTGRTPRKPWPSTRSTVRSSGSSVRTGGSHGATSAPPSA